MTSGQINVLFCIIPDNFNAACSFFVFLSIKYYILSTDMETAVKVGNRHGRPVVYQVNAGAYTNDNINQLLMERHIAKAARRAKSKNHLSGPRKRTLEDDKHFEESFRKLITHAGEK
jgi:uncharacterized protein YaiI (UPF0178 family)